MNFKEIMVGICMIKAFPKIFTIGDNRILDIFDGEVEITEKIDGSQFCCGNINGEFFMRSKGKQMFYESHDNMFNEAVEYVWSVKDRFPVNCIFYFEYLKKPKHNILCYNRVPLNNLAMFGMSDFSGEFFNHASFSKHAHYIGVETVPVIFTGKIKDVSELNKLLDKESVLGNSKIEGIVVKNYNKIVKMDRDLYFYIMCGKYVSEAFKEKHTKTWKKDNTGRGKFELLQEAYRTEARWDKAIQHLRDKGELTDTPKDIGSLLKEINIDLISEEKENIKDQLWDIFGKDILRKATAGFPEYYKKYLLNNAFKEKI